MNLVRLGDLAVDWSAVYMISVVEKSFDRVLPTRINVFAQYAGMDSNPQPLGSVRDGAASRLWGHVRNDKRFMIFDGVEANVPVAIDMSKVWGLSVSEDHSKGVIAFDFGQGRHVSLAILPGLAMSILGTIPTIGSGS